MRRVLDLATDDWQPVKQLAAIITDAEKPSRGAVESVRRACRRLAEQGLLELDYTRDRARHDAADARVPRWSEVCAEKGYEDGARPAHPSWRLSVRRTTGEHR